VWKQLMIRRPRAFAVLPTLLTLANAASGFGSITFAAKVGPETVEGNHLLIAALLIFLGMVFDMLDGSAARWAKHTSEFGAQLDSLCDAISFGVAPAFLMIQFTVNKHVTADLAPVALQYHPRLLWVIAVLFVLCVLMRLARFNVETDDDDSHEIFSGLPSPAAAGTVASFPIAQHGLTDLAIDPQAAGHAMAVIVIPLMKISLPLITLAVACLMVSRVRYPHVFNQLFRGRRNRQHVIQLVFTMAAVYVVREMAIPLIFCYFAFAAPLRAAWSELSRKTFRKVEQP
jgi:CDP-diacylglycerol--serine O-phosphatidyltransferase